MSQDLDSVLHSMSTAAAKCYDLNGNGELTNEEQTVFYQFAEHIILLLSLMHSRYDPISAGLAGNTSAKDELLQVWATTNADLEDFARSTTSPKMRTAVASVAFAIDRTSSIIDAL